jgi:hypothetical protein
MNGEIKTYRFLKNWSGLHKAGDIVLAEAYNQQTWKTLIETETVEDAEVQLGLKSIVGHSIGDNVYMLLDGIVSCKVIGIIAIKGDIDIHWSGGWSYVMHKNEKLIEGVYYYIELDGRIGQSGPYTADKLHKTKQSVINSMLT